jgi:hypothetical protein
MPQGAEAQKIGLLFVHGMGEQPRWDHLRSSVGEFAELLLQTDSESRVTVVDRTDDWPHPPGQPDPGGLAPITLTLTSPTGSFVYECFEVWWADLGSRAGILDVVTFWLWGLGQWAAPIYRELDQAALPKEKLDHLNKPVSTQATLPASVAGNLRTEPISRLQLVLAALSALFVAVTWTLAKRLFATLLGTAPAPTLIVRYVGDVRTYESRAAPGASALSDPARPRRVGIRRRMVSEMVALGTAGLDGWYVLAHSLGTVVAYNGLTETGHALPNYLSEEQWARVPEDFRRDDCVLRDDVANMMPARPSWLEHADVINRKRLFASLRGFLTYGSPLDKFAGLWPRIVATATDRPEQASAFPDECRWINLASPSDPVGAALDSYGTAAGGRLKGVIPAVENYRSPWSLAYGLAHIRYFAGEERFSRGNRAKQKRAVARWLVDPRTLIPDHRQSLPVRIVTEILAYWLLVGLLWALTTALAVVLMEGLSALFSNGSFAWRTFACAWWGALRPVMAVALGLILAMGCLRWRREAWLNIELAKADMARDPHKSKERRGYWQRIVWMERAQAWAAILFMIAVSVALLYGISRDWGALVNWPRQIATEWPRIRAGGGEGGWWTFGTIVGGVVAGTLIQTLLNRMVPPVGKAPG